MSSDVLAGLLSDGDSVNSSLHNEHLKIEIT